MVAATFDIPAEQGSELDLTFTFTNEADDTPLARDTYLARAMVREWAEADGTPLLEMTSAGDTPILTWTASNVLRMLVPAPVLAAVSAGNWAWDCELVPPDGHGGFDEAQAHRVFKGAFVLDAEVTRDDH